MNHDVKKHHHPNGEGLVADTAYVDPSAYVGPDAKVYDNARVYGKAHISGGCVGGDVTVTDSEITGGVIHGKAEVTNARVSGGVIFDAKVTNGEITGGQVMGKEVHIYGGKIEGGTVSTMCGDTKVHMHGGVIKGGTIASAVILSGAEILGGFIGWDPKRGAPVEDQVPALIGKRTVRKGMVLNNGEKLI
jgi:hypothetical protein